MTAASHILALSNAHPGVGGCVKEMFANAEGYVSSGVTPFCNVVLEDDADGDRAFIYFSSHSDLVLATSRHIFDLGHLQNAQHHLHRAFNLGAAITMGKLCAPDKLGMIVVSFSPTSETGIVLRQYIGEGGHMCRVDAVAMTLDHNKMPTLFGTREAERYDRNRIEKLWRDTRWEKDGGVDVKASHADFCQMLYTTTVKHAMARKFATTTFVYLNLKKAEDGTCFLRASDIDIVERDPAAAHAVAHGFRNVVREHFFPAVRGMPMSVGRRRLFQVMGIPIDLAASADDAAPWVARVADIINKPGGSAWYSLIGGKAYAKFSHVGETQKAIVTNFRAYSRSALGADDNGRALPAGAVVLHGDKVISKSPFALHRGETCSVASVAKQRFSENCPRLHRTHRPIHSIQIQACPNPYADSQCTGSCFHRRASHDGTTKFELALRGLQDVDQSSRLQSGGCDPGQIQEILARTRRTSRNLSHLAVVELTERRPGVEVKAFFLNALFP